MAYIRRMDKPEPGLFRMQRVRNGPFVVAEIRYGPHPDAEDRSWLYEAFIDGEYAGEPSPCPIRSGAQRIWEYGHPIDGKEARLISSQKFDKNKPLDIMSIDIKTLCPSRHKESNSGD